MDQKKDYTDKISGKHLNFDTLAGVKNRHRRANFKVA